jgi:uncharacterized protein (TIGR02444 family)
MDAQPLDTPLWDFSLVVYGSDGVADECLALQERLKLDVNLLLFAAYMGAVDGVRLEVVDVVAANALVADWQANVVRQLRQARHALKGTGAEALRAQVKAIELEAEKIEQRMLWQWSREQLASRPRSDCALAGNLSAVLEFYGTRDQSETSLPRLLAVAAAYKS